jgi:hypothetical protein
LDHSKWPNSIIDNNLGGTGSNVYMLQSVAGLSLATLHTASLFIKTDQLSWLYMLMASFGSLTANGYFGADGTEGAVGADIIDSGLLEYPSGWYRAWYSFISDAADGNGSIRAYVANTDGNRTCDLDGTSSILAWGADLREGALDDYVSQAGVTISIGGTRNILAVTRRTADQMNVKQRMARPRDTLRGSFE